MIGVLVITHENFGEAAMQTAELILGKQEQAMALGCYRGDSIESFTEKVKVAIQELDTGDGVLVFADLFGASPYNTAAKASNGIESTFTCITGFSLPMVLEALSTRDVYGLEALTNQCLEVGKAGMKELFAELSKFDEKN